MKTRFLCLCTALIFAASFSFIRCDSGGSDDKDKSSPPAPLTTASYGGADPKGDFIAIDIDGTAKTVTHHNYTTADDHGPYSYSKLTDASLNGGFSNMYITEVFPDMANTYALFVIVDNVAIIYQLFNNNGTESNYDDDTFEGTPGYAFVRKDMDDMLGYKGTAYNWINFHMGDSAGNFEAGFAAFDSNDAPFEGFIYGAAYNSRADFDNWAGYTNGIKTINDSSMCLADFTHDATTMSHNNGGDLTFIPNQNDDCVLDFGENNGAGFAVRQASTGDWQSAYNGTFLMMIYSNDDTGTDQEIEIMKLVLTSGSTAGEGHFTVYNFGETSPVLQGDMVPLEDLEAEDSPGGSTPLSDQLDLASLCGAATSTVVQDAYNAHGGFVTVMDVEDTTPLETIVLFAMMDPAGDYLFFTKFWKDGTNYEYSFGFGVKD